ncbi:MAG: transcription antitermination protein NusB [Mycoplasma sp.]|nr:transcription antitermination protein NusB [Mycoplasma sp.]
MNPSNQEYSVRRYMRAMTIIVVYMYELFNKKLNEKEIFELDIFNDLFDYNKLKTKDKNKISQEQARIITTIEKNYDLFKKMIIKYIREDWSWDRLDPLIRAILLCASVELWKLDIGIVSNEYVEITKDFIPDDKSYKFVNKMIDNIGKEYNEFKIKNN